MNSFHKAPWGMTLIIATVLCTLLLVGFAINGILMGGALGWILSVTLLGFLFSCALFLIQGYTITPTAILVHRAFWKRPISLAGLKSAKSEPAAMGRSWRTFGNGGIFSITGYYRNKTLGDFRAFATDTKRTVVLRFETKTIVLSPADPDDFSREVELKAKLEHQPQ